MDGTASMKEGMKSRTAEMSQFSCTGHTTV